MEDKRKDLVEQLNHRINVLENQLQKSIDLQSETYAENQVLQRVLEQRDELVQEFYQRDRLSIVGEDNAFNLVNSLVLSGYDVIVKLDDYQQYILDKNKRHYTIIYLHQEYEGLQLTVQEI